MRERILWDRIAADPDILHGKPRVRGTRIPVSMVLELLAHGIAPREICAKWYPDLSRADVSACVGFANRLLGGEEIHITAPRKRKRRAAARA